MTSAFQVSAFQSGAFQITLGRPRGWDDAARRAPIVIIDYEDEPEQPKPVKKRKPKRRKAPTYVPEPAFEPIVFEPFAAVEPIVLPRMQPDYSGLALAAALQQQARMRRAADEEAVEMLLLTIN